MLPISYHYLFQDSLKDVPQCSIFLNCIKQNLKYNKTNQKAPFKKFEDLCMTRLLIEGTNKKVDIYFASVVQFL